MQELMINRGHLVGYNNCKSLIWVHYLDINLHRISPSGMDVGKFIMELAANLSPPYEKGMLFLIEEHHFNRGMVQGAWKSWKIHHPS